MNTQPKSPRTDSQREVSFVVVFIAILHAGLLGPFVIELLSR